MNLLDSEIAFKLCSSFIIIRATVSAFAGYNNNKNKQYSKLITSRYTNNRKIYIRD